MNRQAVLAIFSSLFLVYPLSAAPATPADTLRIQRDYQTAMDSWSAEMNAAATGEARSKAFADRPDATPFARQMWSVIRDNLTEDWTLAPAAWFLRTTNGLYATDANGTPQQMFIQEKQTLRDAIEKNHLKSHKLIPVCAVLGTAGDPRSLALLEKIEKENPDLKVQGVAALAAAMQLKALGDTPDIMRKRLTALRKAIIQSADVEVDGTTVAKLAEDELYIISHLTKGRIAPDLIGVDSGGKPLSLSANAGKVIALMFWNSNVPDAKRIVGITTAMAEKFKDRPFVVMGVNNDPLAKLRDLESDGTVPWTNFSDPENRLAHEYRVGSRPLVFILDGDRKIQYTGTPGSFADLTAEALLSEMKNTK